MEISQHFISPSTSNLLNMIPKEYIVSVLATENPYFGQTLSPVMKVPSLSNVAFKLATDIKPNDVRSFLGSELPGYELYDTNIVVPGDGTNYTNLPIESAPPMEVIIEDRAKVKKEFNIPNENNNGKTPTPKKKTILIYHTHSWESFLPLLDGVSGPNEAVSSKVNVSLVGQRIVDGLSKYGIGATDDKTNMTILLKSHGLNYNNAYQMSRTVVLDDIKQNPNYQYFFDIHRDSSGEKITTATINNIRYARIVFVVGEDQPNYQKNLEMAKELNKLLEKKYPGLSRGVLLKNKTMGNGVYNQDLSTHDLLFEIGGVDNNKTELFNAADALVEVIKDYYQKQDQIVTNDN